MTTLGGGGRGITAGGGGRSSTALAAGAIFITRSQDSLFQDFMAGVFSHWLNQTRSSSLMIVLLISKGVPSGRRPE